MTVSFGIHTSKVRVFICQTFLHKRICANVRNLILSRPIICAYTNFDHWRRLRLPDWRGCMDGLQNAIRDRAICVIVYLVECSTDTLWSIHFLYICYGISLRQSFAYYIDHRHIHHPSVRRDVRKILLYIGQHSRSRFGFDYNLSAIHIYSLVWSKSG